jgi:ribosomal-protein-alanine N-acetyltransferase
MSEAPVISVARVPDIPVIMRVMDAAFDPAYGEAWNSAQMLTLFALPSAHVAMISYSGRVCGFYAARVAGPESELLLIAIDPEKRGLGLGRLLIEDWQNWAFKQGSVEFFLEMRADNSALSLYNAAGFSECGRRPAYYRGLDGVVRDAITMRREI